MHNYSLSFINTSHCIIHNTLMKKITNYLSLCLMAAMMMFTSVARADEGMWTLYNLPDAAFRQMQAEGFKLSKDKLFNDEDAIGRSVVNFGGFCSGVVVSPDGLVFTNHHCGFGAINKHSTVEHDYMRDGFVSKSFAEELPNENLFVGFMVSQEDYTEKMAQLGIFSLPLGKQQELIDSVENAENERVKAQDSTLRAELKPFYEGNKYYLTVYQDFMDVRLVFCIPKSMGKFGGETDNWMWPRQTCDYSVFRVYCDPVTGRPAPYSEKNVPYHPKKWAKVSLDGYQNGSFAMTMGYPGSTERYLSSYGIREMRDAIHEPRIKVRGIRQEIMLRYMRSDEALRIKYEDKYAQSSNYWKNAIGMNKCIDSIGIIGMKENHEAMVRNFCDTTGYLKGKLNFPVMYYLYKKRFDYQTAMTYFTETMYRGSEVTSRAIRYGLGMEVKGSGKKQYVSFDDNTDKWDEAAEKEILVALLKNYRESVDKQWLPDFYNTIDTQFAGNYEAYINEIFAKSLLMKKGAKIYFNKKKTDKDLGLQMSYDLADVLGQLRLAMESINEEIALQERYLCDAKIRMEQDLPHYSDANFTLRLSYGQVGGYELDGKDSGYYTEASSIVKKMKQGNEATADKGQYNFEYFAEPVMHDLMSANDFGRYTDRTTGKMQLCFLTNNDITGGNSGSPMFDGNGNLIGLAFDGNWDSLSADIFFDSKLARCIGVDIRYVIYLMDKWGKADRLLKEMGL